MRIGSKLWFLWSQIGLFALELLAFFSIDLKWRKCLEDGTFSFEQIFFKLAVNQDSHKILDTFEFRSDLTSFQNYLPLCTEKHHILPCPVHSLLSFNQIFMRLADNLDRYKIFEESNSGQIGLLTLELLTLN